MKTKHFLLPLALAAFSSCQNDDVQYADFQEDIFDYSDLSGVEKDIYVNIISSKFGGYKKDAPKTRAIDMTITPYIVEGDTTMFIVQYVDGWDLYSANYATDMVLFSSDHGNFEKDIKNAPESLKALIEINANTIKQMPKGEFLNPSWGIASVTEEDLNQCNTIVKTKNGVRVLSNTEEYPPGKWELIETEDLGSTVDLSDKLTKTAWNQEFPYNLYSKKVWVEDMWKSAVAGCVPVALAQYMFYTHDLNGVPATSVTTATPTSNGIDFTFSGSSETIWDDMHFSYSYWGGEEVALLIGKIGHDLNANYGYLATGVNVNLIAPYLLNIYNIEYPLKDYSFSYVKKSIDKKYPVITHFFSNKDKYGNPISQVGHTFLIDQYKTTTSSVKGVYGLIRDPWPSDSGLDDPWESDMVDEEGNIIGYAYTKEIIRSTTKDEVSTNWGGYEFMNNIFYHASGYWTVGSTYYNLGELINERKGI